MFEQTKAFRIRFKLPEAQIGKVTAIRALPFDNDGIHIFEGNYEEFETRRRYLKAHGCEPMELPDMTMKPGRPLPQGIGKTKVANVNGGRDDLDDVSAFKPKPGPANVAAASTAPQGDGKPSPAERAPAKGAADLQQRPGATSADRPTEGVRPERPSLGAEAPLAPVVDAVDDADFDF